MDGIIDATITPPEAPALRGVDVVERLAYSTREVAEQLGVHEETIRQMIRQGRLPAAKIGREWRIHRDVLDQLLRGELDTSGPEEPGQR